MDRVITLQTTVGKEIEANLNSFYNESPDKKTIAYLREKLSKLDKLFAQFQLYDDEINALKENDNHQYFTTNYFERVRSGYDICRKEINKLIEHASSPAPLPSAGSIQPTGIDKGKGAVGKTIPSKSNKDVVQIAVPVDNDNMKRLIRKLAFMMQALENTLQGIDTHNVKSNQYYNIKLESIKHYWNQIMELNTSLLENYDVTSIQDYEPETYFEMESKVQNMIILLQEKVENNANATENGHNRSSENALNGQSSIKLPKLTLPKFDGNYLKWRQFHDLFVQMVHNQNMGNAQKLWYLKMNVSGDAEKLINHLTITDSSYKIAWKALMNRYENKRLLVTALLDRLMTQPALSNDSAASIKNLHDTTKECLSELQNLGLEVMSYWDPIVMHILMKKLDRDTHSSFEQSLRDPKELQSVNQLLKFLENRFQALKALGKKSTQKTAQNKASVFILNNQNKIQCVICHQSHAIYACEKFKKMSVQERNSKIRELNLCINCLKIGHHVVKCASRSCLKCGKRHNTLLHTNKKMRKKS